MAMTTREFVGKQLGTYRATKGISRADVAKGIPVDPTLPGKWENGKRLPTGKTYAKLAELLEIPHDSARLIEEMINELANEASPDWFKLPQVEGKASLLWNFDPTVFPGLLQTEEYCRAIQQAANLATDPEERVESRLHRQRILDQDDPPRLVALIPESVTRNNVGGSKAMYDQLIHVASMAERPHIHVHIVPQHARACAGYSSPFVIATVDGREVGYVDNQLTADMIYETENVTRLRGFFEDFRSDAMDRESSIELIRRVAAEEWNTT